MFTLEGLLAAVRAQEAAARVHAEAAGLTAPDASKTTGEHRSHKAPLESDRTAARNSRLGLLAARLQSPKK